MTTPPPTVAPPSWNEDHLRQVMRSFKPFTPQVRRALERVVSTTRAWERAEAEYLFQGAMTGTAGLLPLRIALKRVAKARREALIAMGEDPETSTLFPPVPVLRDEA